MSDYPELCRKCRREYHILHEGPDKGIIFICGMMVSCGCDGTYYVPKPDASILDTETLQSASEIERCNTAIQDTMFAEEGTLLKFVMRLVDQGDADE